MITPKLEQLIHEGKAQYKTFVLGLSGVAVLPIKKGNFAIITDFVYCPFSNVPEADNLNNLGEIWKNSNKQIEFRSQKSVNHFVFRDSPPYSYIPLKVDTYLVHETDIAINICVIPSLTDGDISTVYGSTPVTTDILQTPSGYAGIDTIRQVHFTAPTQQYIPTGNINAGITAENDYRNQLKVNYDSKSKLINPNAAAYDGFMKDRSYPILNIGYVEINEQPSIKLMTS